MPKTCLPLPPGSLFASLLASDASGLLSCMPPSLPPFLLKSLPLHEYLALDTGHCQGNPTSLPACHPLASPPGLFPCILSACLSIRLNSFLPTYYVSPCRPPCLLPFSLHESRTSCLPLPASLIDSLTHIHNNLLRVCKIVTCFKQIS